MKLEKDVKKFLDDSDRFATLATINEDGTPQQTVMWYLVQDDGSILMNTAHGRKKDRNLHRDQRISICVEDGYRYVSLSGTAELNEDQAIAQADIRALAARYHDEDKADEMMRTQFGTQRRLSITLRPDSIDASGFGD